MLPAFPRKKTVVGASFIARGTRKDMRHCKHPQQSQSHSVELIFAPWFENLSRLTLVPDRRYDIQLSESLKKNVFCDHSFSFRQLLVPKNDKILAF